MRKEWTVEEVLEVGEEMRKPVIAKAAPAERLAGLAPEELQTLVQQLQTYLGQPTKPVNTAEEATVTAQRQTLIHVLQHKFGDLPQTIVDRIVVTIDDVQLTHWLDRALDAKSLTEVDFGQ